MIDKMKKSNWQKNKLGKVLDKGLSNLSENRLYNCDGNYCVYGAAGLVKKVDFYQQSKEYLAIIKDGAGIGRVYQYGPRTSVLGTMQYLIPKNNLNIRFAYHYLSSIDFKKYQHGAAIPHIYYKDYCNEYIALPPLLEQKEIAQTLDKVQELIKLRKEQIEKLDLLIKSKFIDMFGDPVSNLQSWPLKKIGSSFLIKNGGTPSRTIPSYFNGNIPWVTTISLGKDKIGRDDAVGYITKEAVANSATRIIPKNSLLFGIRVGVGKVSINSVPIAINQDIVAIMGIDEKKFNLIYLKKCIEFFTNEFERQKRGATIKGIPSDVLKNTSIPYPPITTQNEFTDFVNKVEENKKVLKDSLSKLETTYKALMQQFFE